MTDAAPPAPRAGDRVPAQMAALNIGGGDGGWVASLAVLVRFAISGSAVAITHLGVVTVLTLSGTPIQLALVLGYLLALGLHFTLNRNWVFASRDGFARGLSAQGIRYLVVALTSYALTAIALAVLPGALGVPDLAVFVVVTLVLGLIGFVVMRFWVFRSGRAA